VSDSGVVKAGKSVGDLFILGLLAGAYISLAGAASMMAAYSLLANPETYGLGRLVVAAIFPCALILIVIAKSELFTGNMLMLLPLAQRRITAFAMLRNWSIVYIANLIGAIGIAFLIVLSGQQSQAPGDLLGGVTVATASSKCNFLFYEAFLLGIFCNWLVCLAIWMAIMAKDLASKVLVMFFPICAFIVAGFEHSIANMYFIPAGLFAVHFNPEFIEVARTLGAPVEALTWRNFFVVNLVPVTLGNIVGGGVCVAMVYWYLNRKKEES